MTHIGGELSLILSYACNFSCAYCPVHKSQETITRDVLSRVISFCLEQSISRIRLFGAEPLLRWQRILDLRRMLDESGPAGQAIEVELTSNASLLNDEILSYWEQDDRYHIRLSLDGDPQSQHKTRGDWPEHLKELRRRIVKRKPLVHCNMVISPQTVGQMLENFHYLYRLGFRFFNLLPAYYQVWSAEDQTRLEQGFDRLAAYCRSIRSVGFPLHLQNERVQTSQALYRDSLVIDTDGEVYTSDAIVCSSLRPLREQLRVGSILDDAFSMHDLKSPTISWASALNQAFGVEAMASTQAVDALLGDFVRKLTVG